MKLSADHEKRLVAMQGRLNNGQPKLRIIAPDERLALKPHGKWAGMPKYVNPMTGAQMECLVLEEWYPPTMMGDEEEWNYELMGPYPSQCGDECCNNGFWGIRMPLMYGDGQFLPLSEGLMRSIEEKQFFDVQWSLLSEVQRQEQLDGIYSAAKTKADGQSIEESNLMIEDYLARKEQEDRADDRVFSFPKGLEPNFKGNKMPIGKPQL